MEEQLKPFLGRWNLVRSENFEEFLKEMGFNPFFRKMAALSSPANEIKLEGSTLILSILTKFYTNVQKIRLNEEYEDVSEKIKYKFSTKFENGRFTIHMVPVDPNGKGKVQTVHRELINDELIMTIHVSDVTCVRAYVREKTS
ncbi:fatty acid-binding protein homolog 8-like [Liolophura sinensis]|uniref:fatty acid-binding protein homolog 8-like n=1 Tax=Liolophura sinensis TaxID=3198878 RepID=UPI0031596EAE